MAGQQDIHELQAVVNHNGRVSDAHHTVVTKNLDGRWFMHDDANVPSEVKTPSKCFAMQEALISCNYSTCIDLQVCHILMHAMILLD